MKKYIIFTLCILLYFPNIRAQIVLRKDQVKQTPFPSSLSEEKKKVLLEKLEATINTYNEIITVADPQKKEVTGESVKTFQKLFIPTAEVMKDYMENVPTELVPIRDYTASVFNLLRYKKGVQVKITEASLLEIIDDPNGFFIPVVRVQKQFYNYVTSKGEVRLSTGGRSMEQVIRFDCPKDDFSQIRISSIRSTSVQKAIAEFVRYAGPSLSIAYGLPNATTSAFWDAEHGDANLDVKGGIGASFGYHFMTNGFAKANSPSKKLYFSAGIQATLTRIQANLNSGFQIKPFTATTLPGLNGTGNYDRIANTFDVTEKHTLATIEAPIGLAFELNHTPKSAFFLLLQVVPGYTFFKKATLKGTANYDAQITDCAWRYLRDGSFNPNDGDFDVFEAGPDVAIDRTPKSNASGFGFGVQLSPMYYTDLSDNDPTWTLGIGLDIKWRPSLFKFEDLTGDVLKYPGTEEPGIVEQYHQKMSYLSGGLRISLQKKIVTKP